MARLRRQHPAAGQEVRAASVASPRRPRWPSRPTSASPASTSARSARRSSTRAATRPRSTLAIDPKFAPIQKDTKAILRQKTLLGETYVELDARLEERAEAGRRRTLNRAQIETHGRARRDPADLRRADEGGVPGLDEGHGAITRDGGGQDLNDALGNLSAFATDGADVLGVLDNQEQALSLFVKNTGVVFGALNERNGQLRGADPELAPHVPGDRDRRRTALAETFAIFPTFLDESRLTLNRLETFSREHQPADQGSAAGRRRPRADDPRRVGAGAGPRVAVRRPAQVSSRLRAPRPARRPSASCAARARRSRRCTSFLQELNPILSFANFNQQVLAGFVTNGSLAFNLDLDSGEPEDGIFDYVLQQFGIINNTSLSVNQTRPDYDLGNAYIAPNAYKRAAAARRDRVVRLQGHAAARRRNPSQGSCPVLRRAAVAVRQQAVPPRHEGPRAQRPRADRGRGHAARHAVGAGRSDRPAAAHSEAAPATARGPRGHDQPGDQRARRARRGPPRCPS